MLLTILRHASAEPGMPGQEDWHRQLEARGRRDARDLGRKLHERGLQFTRLLTSPAARALETAKIVARELKIPPSKIIQDERLYLASSKVLLEVARERGGDAAHLMIAGHNPGITEFADRLSSDRTLDNMPTCAAYTLEFDISAWDELAWCSGTNAQFDYPGSL